MGCIDVDSRLATGSIRHCRIQTTVPETNAFHHVKVRECRLAAPGLLGLLLAELAARTTMLKVCLSLTKNPFELGRGVLTLHEVLARK